MSPIYDLTGVLAIEFGEHTFGDPWCSVDEAKREYVDYSAPLFVDIRIINIEAGEIKEQSVFLGDIPLMTEKGTFVINGTEVVVPAQLVPAPGIYFNRETDEEGDVVLCSASIVPCRGAWLEIEIDEEGGPGVRLGRRKRQPLGILLKALGCETGGIAGLFMGEDPFRASINKEDTDSINMPPAEITRRLRHDGPADVESMSRLLDEHFFNERLYDLTRFGRYRLNKKLGLKVPLETTVLTKEDILGTIRCVASLHAEVEGNDVDDMGNLGNRRVRTAGELILDQFRKGLTHMQADISVRMTEEDWDYATPEGLINIRPLCMAIGGFFKAHPRGNEASGFTVLDYESTELIGNYLVYCASECDQRLLSDYIFSTRSETPN